MGIIVSKEDTNTNLDRRIAADLRARAQAERRHDPDYVDDSTYVEGTKRTGKFTWIWFVLIALAIISLICIIFI